MAVRYHQVGHSYVLKNARFAIEDPWDGGDWLDFSSQVSGVVLTPTVQQELWRSIGGDLTATTAPVTWTCTVSLLQDLQPPVEAEEVWYYVRHSSLLMWLHERAGFGTDDTYSVAVLPDDGLDSALFFDVLPAPATVGGEAGSTPLGSSVNMLVTTHPYWEGSDTLGPYWPWYEETP